MTRHACAVALLVVFAGAEAGAQSIGLRGFADVGSTRFAAQRSFAAVLGEARGRLAGGGGDVIVGPGLFVSLRASRFEDQGQRVFVFNDEIFPLNVETTVTVRPLELTGGYRLRVRRWRVVPYGGAGLSWYRYEETSRAAAAGEDVSETHRGFHLLGGADVRLLRWLAVAGELQWATVPDALGQDPNSVSHAFDETNLGGVTTRVKVIVGRW